MKTIYRLLLILLTLTAISQRIFPQPLDSLAKISPLSETKHEVSIEGKTCRYTAKTGYLTIYDENGKAKGNFFYISYTKDDAKDLKKRPVTFSFNGGPGSSSVWLHLGALGPRRIVLDAEGNVPAPPNELTDNEFSWLDMTDLVFIDPINTGYSRAAKGEKPKQFFGYSSDIAWMANFIRLYTTQNERWLSPKFVIGESYGTTRASGLSEHLIKQHGMYLNGVILVSSILDFQTIIPSGGNFLPYVMFLPAYTATALYHKRLSPDLQADFEGTIQQARDFAYNEYTQAILQGNYMPPEERESVVIKYAELTGLSPEYVNKVNLYVTPERFRTELKRDEAQTVGRFDSRYEIYNYDITGSSTPFDASYAQIDGIFTSCFNAYIREELAYKNDLKYEILSRRAKPWHFSSSNSFLNVSGSLRNAMTQNPHMKVWVANGYMDLATPFFGTEYTFNHLYLPTDLNKNLTMTYYKAGHMMYLKYDCLKQLKEDAKKFYSTTY